jgi:polyhydroxyalkanoate synthesis regulator phasin
MSLNQGDGQHPAKRKPGPMIGEICLPVAEYDAMRAEIDRLSAQVQALNEEIAKQDKRITAQDNDIVASWKAQKAAEAQVQAQGDDFVVRLTPRLRESIGAAIRGGLRVFRGTYGDNLKGYTTSASKRIEGQLWGILKTHPDVSVVTGARSWPENIQKCEQECRNKAAQIEVLEAQVQALQQALRSLRNEAAGFLALADIGTHGVTNMRCLSRRIDEADAVLTASSASADTTPRTP